MLVNEQLSIHDNHISHVYLYDETVSKQTIIAPWQRRFCDSYIKKMLINGQLSFHDNHVSRVY